MDIYLVLGYSALGCKVLVLQCMWLQCVGLQCIELQCVGHGGIQYFTSWDLERLPNILAVIAGFKDLQILSNRCYQTILNHSNSYSLLFITADPPCLGNLGHLGPFVLFCVDCLNCVGPIF
jgi:hypothetical protein